MSSNWNAMNEAALFLAAEDHEFMRTAPEMTDEERQEEADEIEAAEQAEFERREIEYDMRRL